MNFDQLYQDFSDKLLPLVAQGFSLTKDYAFDLFGRYVKFLILTDAMSIAALLLMIFITLYIVRKTNKFGWEKHDRPMSYHNGNTKYEVLVWPVFVVIGGIIATFVMGLGLWHKTKDLTMDVTVPEVRIYYIIKEYQSNEDTQKLK